MERERRRAVELSLEMLQRLKQLAFEELYDCQTKLEGLGQDVPAEMVRNSTFTQFTCSLAIQHYAERPDSALF